MNQRKGRPSKLTPERQAKICDLIRAGNYEIVAANACGVATSTYMAWKQKGEQQKSGRYREFLEAVNEAKVAAETLHVARIMAAGRKDWKASAWYLERKHHDRWGRKDYRGTLGADGKPVEPTQTPVLIVPAEVEDIHEWAKRSQKAIKTAQQPQDEDAAELPE